MAISVAEYDIITKIVDERMEMYRKRLEEIKIEREDFHELKKEVASLTKSVNLLTYAQTRTEERMGRLEQAVEKLTQAQAKTEERVEELAQAQIKTEKAVKELSVNIGGLSETIGFGLEDIAKIVVPGYLERHEKIYMEEFERRFIYLDGKEEIEIDLWAETEREKKKLLIIGEVKSRIYSAEVKRFISRILEPIRKIEKDKEIYPLMFGYVIHPSAQAMAQEAGIHLIASYQK